MHPVKLDPPHWAYLEAVHVDEAAAEDTVDDAGVVDAIVDEALVEDAELIMIVANDVCDVEEACTETVVELVVPEEPPDTVPEP